MERACDRWWILSALHELVDVNDVLEPYDFTLIGASRAEKRVWSGTVLASIDDRVHASEGDTFELHAGGNHRGSIFRLHVGTALLTSGDWPEGARASWGSGTTAKGRLREDEYLVEVAVSQHIGSMPFLWVAVDDEPDAASDRAVIETGAIAPLSNAGRPAIDSPSALWLGQPANREAVRTSGLWNVEHLRGSPSVGFLDVLGRRVEAITAV